MGNICRNCGKKISFMDNYYTMSYTGTVFCQQCSKEIIALLQPVHLLSSSKSSHQIEDEFHQNLAKSGFDNSIKTLIEDEFKNIFAEKKKALYGCRRSFRIGFEEALNLVKEAGERLGKLKKEPDVMNMGEIHIATCIFEKFYLRNGSWTALIVTIVSNNQVSSLTASGTGGGTGLINDSWGTEDEIEDTFWKNLESFSRKLIESEIPYDDYSVTDSLPNNDVSKPKCRIGVLGGTFDPVHSAHVALGKAAIDELELRKLIVMPARVQPFKQGKKTADDIHRKTMAKLAFADCDNVEVSDYEMNRSSLSYTINTLMHLKHEYPEDKIFFISGTDSFIEMERWYRGSEMLSGFSFAVSIRPGYREYELNKKIAEYRQKYQSTIIKINADMPSISSTKVREYISAGKIISDMVPSQVERYIRENDLYK